MAKGIQEKGMIFFESCFFVSRDLGFWLGQFDLRIKMGYDVKWLRRKVN